MPKALFCAANSWFSFSRVGSHHLARGLAQQGWDIVYISDPISPLHFLNGLSPELSKRIELYKCGGKYVEENIWAYVPFALGTPHNKLILRSKWIMFNWHRLTMPNLVNKVASIGFDDVDLIYVDSVTQAAWWSKIKHKKAIYRLADNPEGFSKYTEASGKALRHLAQAVDSIVYTSESLQNFSENLSPKKSVLLQNGVDYKHFQIETSCPREYKNDPRPKAVYVGAIEEWFDFSLVNELVKTKPHVLFVIIGPDALAKKYLNKAENLLILGVRSFQELPAYLQYAAVGLIPFDTKRHNTLISAVNPLKLYEYFACGLPVVSSYWQALDNIKSPAILAKGHEDFKTALDTALAMDLPKNFYQKFALDFDWSKRIEQLLHLC